MEYKDMPVDKLLWNTRMYPGCVSATESAAELGRRLADAQATVEALQRERSKKQAEEAMVVFAQLSQLQALVRPFAELAKHLDGREFNTLHAILRNGTWIKVTMDDFMALKAATLDATTPAPRQRQVHSCEIPGCVSCANPEEGGDGE